MSHYWAEFLTVAVVHLLGVASPGPDFAVMLRQALRQSRRNALLTAAGIGLGILVHVGYSLLGIGLIIQQSVTLFTAIKLMGAAYLAWIGLQCLKAASGVHVDLSSGGNERPSQTPWGAFRLGLFTNLLNPKATLFFLSLFSVVISPGTPGWVQAGYGVYLALATGLWFSMVAVFFTLPRVRKVYSRFGHWLDRAMGLILLLLAGQLVWSSL